jgi:uncharacterized damage-inducible protein DinB
LDAAAQLSPEELTRDFGTADHSVLGTLLHIYSADRVWLARIQSTPQKAFAAEFSLAELQKEWPALHERWRNWAAQLTDSDAATELAYHDLKGRPWKQELWQIVLHVVNHGAHHRGQASGFIRSMGHTPPPLDLIAFYRERMAASA